MSDPFGPPFKRPAKKTYGKSVKSHVSSWFGSKLWTEKDSEDARKKEEKNITVGRSAISVVQERKRTVVEPAESDDEVEEILTKLQTVKLEERTVETGVVTVVETLEAVEEPLSSDGGKSRESRKSTRGKRKEAEETAKEDDATDPAVTASEEPTPPTDYISLELTDKEDEAPKKNSTRSKKKKTPALEVPETPYPQRTASPSKSSDTLEPPTQSEPETRSSRSKKSTRSRKSLKEDARTVEETPARKQILAAVEIMTPARSIAPTATSPSPVPTKAAEKPKKRLGASMMTTTQPVVPATPQPEQKTPKRIAPIPVSPLVASVEQRRGSVKKKPPSPTTTPNKRLFSPRELPRYKAPSEEYNEKIVVHADEKLEDVVDAVTGVATEEVEKPKARSRAKPKRVQPTLVTVEEKAPTAEDALDFPKTRKSARSAAFPKEEEKKEPRRQKMVAVEIPSTPVSFKTADEYIEPEQPGEEEEEYEEFDQEAFDAKLETLLAFCAKPTILDFTEYTDKLERESLTVKKLGEASFSEVFVKEAKGGRQIVIKIIPFGGEDQCQIDEILQEVKITHMMSAFEGFIQFNGLVVTSGFYPERLIDMWDDYADAKGTENDRPDFYEEDQLYAIILLEHGGRDLEHFELSSWAEAADVFWQTVRILALGEEKAEFEHRDLHWGNIVIKRLPGLPPKNRNKPLHKLVSSLSITDGTESHLKVSLIDYTLSRARLPAHKLVTYTPLSDPALFTGKGDYQYDIYRFMRRHFQATSPCPSDGSEDLDLDEPGTAWAGYRPKTNLFWLHYLYNVLVNKKGLKRPGGGRRAGDVSEEEERAFKGLECVGKRIDPRKKRWAGEEVEIGSARDLWRWAEAEELI